MKAWQFVSEDHPLELREVPEPTPGSDELVIEVAAAGIPYGAVQTEHRGSLARRMQCVHCKGITEDVTTDPFVCSHCGLNLFVRDHYSRRLAAFQGVCIDAEDPGNVPEPVELYK